LTDILLTIKASYLGRSRATRASKPRTTLTDILLTIKAQRNSGDEDA